MILCKPHCEINSPKIRLTNERLQIDRDGRVDVMHQQTVVLWFFRQKTCRRAPAAHATKCSNWYPPRCRVWLAAWFSWRPGRRSETGGQSWTTLKAAIFCADCCMLHKWMGRERTPPFRTPESTGNIEGSIVHTDLSIKLRHTFWPTLAKPAARFSDWESIRQVPGTLSLPDNNGLTAIVHRPTFSTFQQRSQTPQSSENRMAANARRDSPPFVWYYIWSKFPSPLTSTQLITPVS